jgi:hypothetical protein
MKTLIFEMYPLLFFTMHIRQYQGRTAHNEIQEEIVAWSKLKDDGRSVLIPKLDSTLNKNKKKSIVE